MVSNAPKISVPVDIRDSTAYEVQYGWPGRVLYSTFRQGGMPLDVSLEKGEIYFFYKPKTGVDNPESKDDVQHLYIVLRPEEAEKKVEEKQSSDSGNEGKFRAKEEEESHRSPKTGVKAASMDIEQDLEVHSVVTENLVDTTVHGGLKVTDEHGHKKFLPYKTVAAGGHGTERVEIGKKALFRYLVMGRKHLPLPKHTSPFWGFVELVTTNPADIKKVLNDENTEVDTVQGEQSNPIARPVGEGVYSLVRHHTAVRTSTHLVYKLETPGPHKKHDPEDALNIEPQASFVIQIKNPEQPAPASTNGVGSKRRAFFPAHLQGRIGSRRFLPADPLDLLNYEGVEFVLLSAHDDVDAELGNDISFHNHDLLPGGAPDELMQYLVGGAKHHKRLIRPLIEGQWA